MTIAMAAMLSACGHRASQGSENSENSEFTTDSIGLEKEDSMASVKVCVDWPASGNDSLLFASTFMRNWLQDLCKKESRR